MARETKVFSLRVPLDLYTFLQTTAAKEYVTLHAMIIRILVKEMNRGGQS